MTKKEKRREEAAAELRAVVKKYHVETVFAQVVRHYEDGDRVPRTAIKIFAIETKGLRASYAGTPVIWLTRVVAHEGDLELRNGSIRVYSPDEIEESINRAIFGASVGSGDRRIRLHLLPLL